jgi:GNAT superfamily N-acetyltransferase
MKRGLTFRQWVGYVGFALVFLLTAAVAVWRGDILRAGLDPQVPFQTYEPPPAPDYSDRGAWALLNARTGNAGPAAVFFVHSTTFNGGRDWNGPVGDPEADAYLRRVVLPNYAAPFARAGAVSAPLYRQASLYTRLTLRDDAREARAFAYQDIEAAFDAWLARNPDGPIVLAGVEQGGDLLDRLIRERIASDPDVRGRLVAAYLMDTIIATANLQPAVPACADRRQVGCVVAWSEVGQGDDGAARRRLRRALVWDGRGRLVDLADRPTVCVNPVTGSTDEAGAPARMHRGATNATGLEWGARPALIAREVTAQCRDGLLRHSQPDLESFRTGGSWADRRKARPYNLFYGDLEADVSARLAAYEHKVS